MVPQFWFLCSLIPPNASFISGSWQEDRLELRGRAAALMATNACCSEVRSDEINVLRSPGGAGYMGVVRTDDIRK